MFDVMYGEGRRAAAPFKEKVLRGGYSIIRVCREFRVNFDAG